MRRFKRTRFLINSLQTRLLFFNLLYLISFLLIFGALLVTPLILRTRSETVSPLELERAAMALVTIHSGVLPALLVALVGFGIHSILFTHRIAGPIYRFTQVFGAVRDGDLTPMVAVRRKDHLQSEARLLKAMVISLRERVSAIQREQRHAAESWETLRAELDAASAPELQPLIGELTASIDRSVELMAAFRAGETEPPSGHSARFDPESALPARESLDSQTFAK